ncbi:hypothetical protein ACCT28_17240 [Rhizobium ruizarguesonis]
METKPGKIREEVLGPIADLRDRGYLSCVIPWREVVPSEVFSLFDALQESVTTADDPASYHHVDRLLVERAGNTPLQSTSPVERLYYEVDGLIGYGHSYFPGTLRALQEQCSIPRPLRELWEALEMTIAIADPVLRTALSGFPGLDELPSGIRVWKYIHNSLPWVSPPHYDLTVFSAILATANPEEELLTIGLEANGAPIKLIRARTEGLKKFTPTPNQFSIVLPGIYSNRWDLEPTWHYVRALRPGTFRHSLVLGLNHPSHHPVRATRHVQDEIAPNEVIWR